MTKKFDTSNVVKQICEATGCGLAFSRRRSYGDGVPASFFCPRGHKTVAAKESPYDKSLTIPTSAQTEAEED